MPYINKTLFESSDRQMIAQRINFEISDILHQSGMFTDDIFPLIPYLLYKAKSYTTPIALSLDSIVNGELDVNNDVKFLSSSKLNE